MLKFIMFIIAVCVLFLIKLRWPRNESLYNLTLFRTDSDPVHGQTCRNFHTLFRIERPNPPRGGIQQSFIRGGSAPRSKPLPFYVPCLIEKVPLLHTSYRKWYPFHIPSWGFKIFCPFQISKWQFSLPFPILELVKSLPFHIPPA